MIAYKVSYINFYGEEYNQRYFLDPAVANKHYVEMVESPVENDPDGWSVEEITIE